MSDHDEIARETRDGAVDLICEHFHIDKPLKRAYVSVQVSRAIERAVKEADDLERYVKLEERKRADRAEAEVARLEDHVRSAQEVAQRAKAEVARLRDLNSTHCHDYNKMLADAVDRDAALAKHKAVVEAAREWKRLMDESPDHAPDAETDAHDALQFAAEDAFWAALNREGGE